MTIKNNGYKESVNTSPCSFGVTIYNVRYSSDFATYSLGKWDTVDVLNGGTHAGTVVFQIPKA
jgi:hypothetical protein